MKTGIELIAEERATHIKRGYDALHDSEHDDGALADMAAIYACTHRDDTFEHGSSLRKLIWGGNVTGKRDYNPNDWFTEQPDRLTELAKAGSFIAAEMDRIINLQSEKKKYARRSK